MREIGLHRRAADVRKRRGARLPLRSTGGTIEPRSPASGGASGLARAAQVRAKAEARDAELASQSGISADDRKDIQNEIDEVSRRNRISASAEDFLVRPIRKGFVFPLVVNLIAIAATACAVLLLSFVFRQRDIAIASSSSALDTAEGKLLQELKRDSDSKLQEKDKAISDIQTRLVSLDKERNDLAANIDQKVKARETELRSKLQVELDAEKKRLADQGISSNDLQTRIKAYEAERTAALDKQMADARRAAEAEKAAAEDKFKQLRVEYQKSISDLGDERRRIQDEARKREDALKASLEAKTKELESQSAAAKAGLDKARSELAGLEEQKAKAKAEDDRVLGLYGTIRTAIRDRRYSDAFDGASALASYLRDPALRSDASLQPRRDADLFVAETLGAYARSELDRASVDASKLLAQADLVASARDASLAAQTALKAGDSALAAAKYREALGKMPEILAAHEYFLGQLQAAESLRRGRLEDALLAAERAFKAGDQASASARYSEALGYLPINEAARAALVSRLGQLAVFEAEKARNAADTRAARPLLSSAAAKLQARDWPGAIAGYIGLLASYPAADQAGDALKGIEAARADMERSAQVRAESAQAAAAAAVAAAQQELADAQAASAAATATSSAGLSEARATAAATEARLRSDNDALGKQLAAAEAGGAQAAAAAKATEAGLRSDIEALKKQLEEARTRTPAVAAAANPAVDAAAQAAQAGQIAALQAEVQRLASESARLASEAEKNKEGSAKYEALASSYQNYLASEGSALNKGGQGVSLAVQSSLYAFLGDAGVSAAFPGLRERISAFQSAAQSELLDAFPSDASEIVQQALAYKDKAALRAYYASKRDVYSKSGNALMVNFLDAVSKVVY